jgi:glycolate oxidase
MIAEVESFVPAGTIQVEAMKKGLNCNMAGVGAGGSLLAGTAGHMGNGPSSIFMGIASENLLGAEWVLPDGEIIRTGTFGSVREGFCGEGPGPSPRAILRGWLGTAGTMGVCTRIFIRLHPWPGPKYLPVRGTAPVYKMDRGLENFRSVTLCLPDWDAYAECFRLLFEADISYLAHRQFDLFGRELKAAMLDVVSHPEKQFCDLPALMQEEKIKAATEEMKIDIQLVMAGFTERDLDYKEKALDDILRQVGGKKSAYMSEKELYDFVLLYMVRLGRKNYNFTLCGAFEGNFGLSSNVFVAAPLMEEATDIKRTWEQEHEYFAAVGGDSDMGSVSGIGGGGTTGWEFFTHFDAFDRASIRGTKEFFDATQTWMMDKGLGADMSRWNFEARREDGYHYTQAQHDELFRNLAQPALGEYQYKVREAFNPNNLTGSYYRTKTPGK